MNTLKKFASERPIELLAGIIALLCIAIPNDAVRGFGLWIACLAVLSLVEEPLVILLVACIVGVGFVIASPFIYGPTIARTVVRSAAFRYVFHGTRAVANGTTSWYLSAWKLFVLSELVFWLCVLVYWRRQKRQVSLET